MEILLDDLRRVANRSVIVPSRGLCLNCQQNQPLDNPGVIAFPPLIWLVNVVISILVHLFVRLPIMSYRICLVCGIVFIILAPTLALSAFRTMKAAEQTFTRLNLR